MTNRISPGTESALKLLQASSCFRGEVCTSLPCACAETLAASLGVAPMTAPITSREAPSKDEVVAWLRHFASLRIFDDGVPMHSNLMLNKAADLITDVAQALPPSFGTIPNPEAVRKANHGIGKWLSAALDDPAVCGAMKSDINAWFDAHEPWPEIASPMPSTLHSPPLDLPPHNSGERLPSSDAATGGGEAEMYRIRDLIASHMLCEDDCKKFPSGCGCALTAARAVVTSKDRGGK